MMKSPIPRIPRLALKSTAVLMAFFGLIAAIPIESEAAREEREPLDLTIIERQAELAPQMTQRQRLQLLRIEEAIAQARSDLRSGEFMATTEESAMQPNLDIREIQERGRKLIADAEAALYENQKALIELLEAVKERQETFRAVTAAPLRLELDVLSFDAALETACRSVMEATWREGYEALFFHEGFIRNAEGLRQADTAIRNQLYDLLVAIDGTNFSLTVPVEFQLKPDTAGDKKSVFSYENADAFERTKKALVAVEIIVPDGSSTGLVSVRTIDMASQRIVAAELVKIADAAQFSTAEDDEALADNTRQQVVLSGEVENIRRVAALPEPYLFNVETDASDITVGALVGQTIFEQTELMLAGSNFIADAYGMGLTDPEAWRGQANGRILIAQADSENGYKLGLQVEGSNRTLPAGSVALANADSPPAESEE